MAIDTLQRTPSLQPLIYGIRMNKQNSCCKSLTLAALILFAPSLLIAETVTLHCSGVNYIYESGMGKGPATRKAANLTVNLDDRQMRAELIDGDKARTTNLVRVYDDYQGYFPGEKEIAGAAVLGEQIEISSGLDSVELRYLLEGDRKYLSYTGTCNR